MTQRQLEKLIHTNGGGLKDVRSVVMIQCVGSRDDGHPYCSRICCNHAVKNALKLKEKNPAIRVIAVQPTQGHDIPGLRNLSQLEVSKLFDRSLVDEIGQQRLDQRPVDVARRQGRGVRRQ